MILVILEQIKLKNLSNQDLLKSKQKQEYLIINYKKFVNWKWINIKLNPNWKMPTKTYKEEVKQMRRMMRN